MPSGLVSPGSPHPGPGLLFFPAQDQAAQRWEIAGVTRDSAGGVLGGCTVDLFTTTDDVLRATTTSDPTTGAYSFQVPTAESYYCRAYLAGAPDVAGTTVGTLTGAAV